MTQSLQPGNVPAWSGDDPSNTIADIFANETWPELWGKFTYTYANTGARDAELAGLGPSDAAFAFTRDTSTLWGWTGTTWAAIGSGATPAHTTYTPTMTQTSGLAYNVGNGSCTGRWSQVPGTKIVHLNIRYTFGSTSNQGDSDYRWSLPSGVTAVTNGAFWSGTASVLKGGVFYPAVVQFVNQSTIVAVRCSNEDRIGFNSPSVTWASGDIIAANIVFERS